MTRIIRIPLRLSNAYLIQGERAAVLVDTGVAKEGRRILQAAEAAGVPAKSITLIAHTHGHSDHAGSTAVLAALLNVPVALHTGDLAMALAGNNGVVRTRGLSGKLVLPFVDLPFPPYQPTVLIDEGLDLSPFGVEAQVWHTPGHTSGSISILCNAGLIAGDVMIGGFMGGHVLPGVPGYHYFADSPAQIDASIRRLLTHNTGPFYVGHGGPLQHAAVKAWLHTQRDWLALACCLNHTYGHPL